MKLIFLLFSIFLFINSVGTDESVSVYEGDSVTLHTNTVIQRDSVTDWRFKGFLIARINRVANSLKITDDVLDGRFRDRLQVNNQTGDLTITNINTEDSGVYQLYIKINVSKTINFSVHVSVHTDKVKTVMVGDSVIQHNNVTKKPGDEKMMLRIQHNNSLVAEINDTVLTYNVNGERFRDRLQVDYQTGDLIITNIRPEDSGSYEVNITVGSHIYTIHRSFNVNVVKGVDPQKDNLGSNKDEDQSSSKSSGVIAGVCVVLLVLAVLAVAVAVFLYRRPSKDARKRVSTEDPDGGL